MEISNFSKTQQSSTNLSNVKTMLITFFDIKYLIYDEFVPTGQMVNQTYYKEFLIEL